MGGAIISGFLPMENRAAISRSMKTTMKIFLFILILSIRKIFVVFVVIK